jgi:uncharacterized protein YwqG
MKPELEELFEEHDLEAWMDAIVEAARLAAAIETTEPDGYQNVGSSRLGGHPDLPQGMEYPKIDGELLAFIGQINLEDVPETGRRLPKLGWLYFFLGMNETCSDVESRVLFYQGDRSSLETCRPPKDARFRYDFGDSQDKPFQVRFEQRLDLPDTEAVTDLGLDDSEIDQYVELTEKWEDDVFPASHQLAGNVNMAIPEIVEQAIGQQDDSDVDSWILLARFGWDKNVGFDFWDAGTLQFLIRRQDLETGHFDKTCACIVTF